MSSYWEWTAVGMGLPGAQSEDAEEVEDRAPHSEACAVNMPRKSRTLEELGEELNVLTMPVIIAVTRLFWKHAEVTGIGAERVISHKHLGDILKG